MGKQQTAVDWLINEILKHDKSFVEFYGAEILQAKQMEKEQIVNAWIATDNELQRIAAEQYYKQTLNP